MFARISIIETRNGEAVSTTNVQGSEATARKLHGILNGVVSKAGDDGITELSVTAERRIAGAPRYEDIEL